MKSFRLTAAPIWVVLVALLPACRSQAIDISGAWVRATVPGQEVAAAYMKIRSPFDSELVAVTSELATQVEIHSMNMEDGMMQMRRLEKLHLPANETVSLEPAGYHLMLLELRKPLNKGEKLPLKLTFKRNDNGRQTVEIKADVRGDDAE
jgi:copper(I)-binding protein